MVQRLFHSGYSNFRFRTSALRASRLKEVTQRGSLGAEGMGHVYVVKLFCSD
jgi:hypothetical protein